MQNKLIEMSENLSRAGIFFDELNKIKVWEPDAAQRTVDLKDECKDFVEKISDFHKTADEFITIIEALAKQVEREKIHALGASNRLKSMAKQRETQQQQFQGLIMEKSTELERLRVQHQALLRIEAEQMELLDQLQSG